MKLSASKLKTFMSCDRKYYYEYHGARSAPSVAMILGTAVHWGVERGYMGDDPQKSYVTRWNDELAIHGHTHDAKMFKRGLEMILSYDFSVKPDLIEEYFVMPFPIVGDALCDIAGVFDQVFPWGIRDMKTGARRPNQMMLENDLQFIIYGQAYKYLYGKNPERMVWLHMEKMEEFEARTVLQPEKVDLALRTVERLLEAEQRGVFDKRIDLGCTWCPFAAQCLGMEACQDT